MVSDRKCHSHVAVSYRGCPCSLYPVPVTTKYQDSLRSQSGNLSLIVSAAHSTSKALFWRFLILVHFNSSSLALYVPKCFKIFSQWHLSKSGLSRKKKKKNIRSWSKWPPWKFMPPIPVSIVPVSPKVLGKRDASTWRHNKRLTDWSWNYNFWRVTLGSSCQEAIAVFIASGMFDPDHHGWQGFFYLMKTRRDMFSLQLIQ